MTPIIVPGNIVIEMYLDNVIKKHTDLFIYLFTFLGVGGELDRM